ncbi:MAG: hypothetical protein ACD_18C00339G0001 [uncultured bacterium]|nr:MAG: hypothetical protein ACD_18C00339G0001 [uncultured bacterium]
MFAGRQVRQSYFLSKMLNLNNNQIQEAIIKTLAYFDVSFFPLTKEELAKLLWSPHKILEKDLDLNLTELMVQERIEKKHNFYFLKGREENIKIRQLRVKFVEEKMVIAKRAVNKLRRVPFLRAVFICNTVAAGVPNSDSDIDVFIITRKNYLWVVRFFSTILLKFFRLRTSELNHKDRVCLSFYATDANLNLEELSLKNKADIYLVYWILSLVPIYDPDNLRISLLRANKWLENYVHLEDNHYGLSDYWQVEEKNSDREWKKSLENFLSNKKILLKFFHSVQKSKIRKNYGLYADMPDTRVVISEDFLKFHENDRRKEYYDKWVHTCKELV